MTTRQEARHIVTQRYQRQTTPATQPRPAQTAAQARKINFRIERLTLEGYTRADQARFTRTLEKTLRDLVTAAPGFDWAAATGADRIDAGTLLSGTTPERAARHTARQIFLNLQRQRRHTKEAANA